MYLGTLVPVGTSEARSSSLLIWADLVPLADLICIIVVNVWFEFLIVVLYLWLTLTPRNDMLPCSGLVVICWFYSFGSGQRCLCISPLSVYFSPIRTSIHLKSVLVPYVLEIMRLPWQNFVMGCLLLVYSALSYASCCDDCAILVGTSTCEACCEWVGTSSVLILFVNTCDKLLMLVGLSVLMPSLSVESEIHQGLNCENNKVKGQNNFCGNNPSWRVICANKLNFNKQVKL
jgi:hypothetical protein